MEEVTPQVTEQAQPATQDQVSGDPFSANAIQNTLDQAFREFGGTIPTVDPVKAETQVVDPAKTETKAVDSSVEQTAQKDAAQQQDQQATDKDVLHTDDPSETKEQSKWMLYKSGYKKSLQLEKEMAEAAAKHQAELAELQAKLQGFEGSKGQFEATQKELESLKTEREQINARLYREDVTAHPKFQEQVIKPFEEIKSVAEQLAKDNEIDASELFAAIVRGEKKKMKELTSGLDVYDQLAVGNLFTDMRHIVAARDHLLADSKATRDAWVKAEQEAAQQKESGIKDARAKAIDTIVPALTEKVVSLLPEDKRRNLNELRNEVLGFEGMPEEVKMYAGFASVLMPEVLEHLTNVQGQLKAAQAEIAKLRGGTPKVASNGQPAVQPTAAPQPTINASMTERDFAAESLARIRESMGLPKV